MSSRDVKSRVFSEHIPRDLAIWQLLLDGGNSLSELRDLVEEVYGRENYGRT